MGIEIWSGLVIGLAGSLHCLGMCGPIAIAIPRGGTNRFKFLLGRLNYNLGRVITYSLMGVLCGFLGKIVLLSGYQNILSIILGLLLLLYLVIPGKFKTGFGWQQKLFGSVKNLWGNLTRKGTPGSLLVLGILNGFLPCGLVYVALAGAIATGSVFGGVAYMALFGLGTIPMMLVLSLAGTLVGIKFKQYLKRLLPVGIFILASLFIVRGLSLGIPYISPNVKITSEGETKSDCCKGHHPVEEAESTAP